MERYQGIADAIWRVIPVHIAVDEEGENGEETGQVRVSCAVVGPGPVRRRYHSVKGTKGRPCGSRNITAYRSPGRPRTLRIVVPRGCSSPIMPCPITSPPRRRPYRTCC